MDVKAFWNAVLRQDVWKRNGGKMQKKETVRQKRRYDAKKLIYILPVTLLLSILLVGACHKAIPDDVYYDAYLSSEVAQGVSASVNDNSPEVTYTAKLFGFLPAKNVEGKLSSELRLTPSGDVFGVKFFTKGVIITDISEVESDEGIICPAAKAGLKKGDIYRALTEEE